MMEAWLLVLVGHLGTEALCMTRLLHKKCACSLSASSCVLHTAIINIITTNEGFGMERGAARR